MGRHSSRTLMQDRRGRHLVWGRGWQHMRAHRTPRRMLPLAVLARLVEVVGPPCLCIDALPPARRQA
jgi:hypothetical protein